MEAQHKLKLLKIFGYQENATKLIYFHLKWHRKTINLLDYTGKYIKEGPIKVLHNVTYAVGYSMYIGSKLYISNIQYMYRLITQLGTFHTACTY